MQTPKARFSPRTAASKWLIALVAVAMVIGAVALLGGSPFDARAQAQPTPCPDAIACHALKRMPQQNRAPSNTP